MVYIVFTAFPVQIAVGYLCMGVFAWLVAPSWGAACTTRLSLAGLSGVLVFLLGVVSGSLASVFVVRDFSILDFAAALYWLALCGVVPAFFIGFVGGCVSRLLYPDPATSALRF